MKLAKCLIGFIVSLAVLCLLIEGILYFIEMNIEWLQSINVFLLIVLCIATIVGAIIVGWAISISFTYYLIPIVENRNTLIVAKYATIISVIGFIGFFINCLTVFSEFNFTSAIVITSTLVIAIALGKGLALALKFIERSS